MEPELSGDMDTGTLATAAGTPHCSMIYNSNAEHTANTAQHLDTVSPLRAVQSLG